MRILVTGGFGFLGGAFCKHILDEHTVDVLTRDAHNDVEVPGVADVIRADIADPATLPEQFDHDVVVHFAGIPDPASCDKDPARAFMTNAMGAAHIARRTRGRFVMISTGQVYGNQPGPLTEQTVPAPRSVYATTKLSGEHLVSAIIPPDQLSIVRVFNVYGPGQRGPFLIPELLERAAKQGKVSVRQANSYRDFTFVEDAARMIARTMTKEPGTYNLASGQSASSGDIASLIATAMNVPPAVEETNPGAPSTVTVDPTLAKESLGWTATTQLTDGLRKTVEWYRGEFS